MHLHYENMVQFEDIWALWLGKLKVQHNSDFEVSKQRLQNIQPQESTPKCKPRKLMPIKPVNISLQEKTNLSDSIIEIRVELVNNTFVLYNLKIIK